MNRPKVRDASIGIAVLVVGGLILYILVMVSILLTMQVLWRAQVS